MHYLHNAIHDYVAINLHRNQEDYENDDSCSGTKYGEKNGAYSHIMEPNS
jgi:hypothetical protein